MKKKILSVTLGLTMMVIGAKAYAVNSIPVNTVKPATSVKVMSDFKKQFKDAVDPAIYSSKDGFIVRSQTDGHNVTSAYNKKGNWVYTIKYFPTDNLAKNIIDLVKGSYNKFFITSMEKVDQPGNTSVYVVHMEHDNAFKTLRVVNNEVELMQDFPKT